MATADDHAHLQRDVEQGDQPKRPLPRHRLRRHRSAGAGAARGRLPRARRLGVARWAPRPGTPRLRASPPAVGRGRPRRDHAQPGLDPGAGRPAGAAARAVKANAYGHGVVAVGTAPRAARRRRPGDGQRRRCGRRSPRPGSTLPILLYGAQLRRATVPARPRADADGVSTAPAAGDRGRRAAGPPGERARQGRRRHRPARRPTRRGARRSSREVARPRRMSGWRASTPTSRSRTRPARPGRDGASTRSPSWSAGSRPSMASRSVRAGLGELGASPAASPTA